MAIFNSYVKLPEGIWPCFQHRCSPGSTGVLGGSTSPAASAARSHLAQDVQHAAGVGGAALVLGFGWENWDQNGSVSKPCTPGEHQNSW